MRLFLEPDSSCEIDSAPGSSCVISLLLIVSVGLFPSFEEAVVLFLRLIAAVGLVLSLAVAVELFLRNLRAAVVLFHA
jgi:hypothetical protein